ncbi:hypothetical protein ABZS77_05325 [Micromonospora sp. NPDC005298]|uniref:hypothetical protein n=1 Tax=Micromonospora sp. NPDC005298 TaxID=3156873 RepID=UPI0033ADD034
MRIPRLAVPALVLCAALAACGETNDPTAPGPSAPATGQPSAEPSPSTAVPATSDPAVTTTPSAPVRRPKPGGPTLPPPVGATTLTGTITAGVEPNCVLLDGYLLLGGPRDLLVSGAKVTVTGRVEAGVMTTCQQGTPFQVETALPA